MPEIWTILHTTMSSPRLFIPAFMDVILVALPFYVIFSLLRESRSFAALWGIISVMTLCFVLYLVAKIGHLEATALIYEKFWIVVVMIFLIIFQGELKKGLSDIGQLPFLRSFFPREKETVSEIVEAVQALSERQIGALIVLERGTSLRPFLGTGTMLDAEISSELLRTIFVTQSPLHDGAVIIRGNRIVAAGCILPLTEDPRLSRDLGTRHRAAIGVSEETDALVVIASEETGIISVAKRGRIERHLTPEDLRKSMERDLELYGEGVHSIDD